MVAEPQETTKQKIIQALELAGIEIAGDPITNVYPTPRASGYWTVEAVGSDRHVRKQLEDAGAINILGVSEEIDGREIAVMRFTPDFLGKPVLQVTDFTVRQLPSSVQPIEKVFAPFVERESDDNSPRNDSPIPPRADTQKAVNGDKTAKDYAELTASAIEGLSDENARRVSLALHWLVDIVNGKPTMQYTNGNITVIQTKDVQTMTTELSKAQATVGRLNMDVERFKAELDAAKNRVIDPGEVGQLRKQITQLQNDLQIAQNRPTGEQLAEAQRELLAAKNEIVALKTERDDLKLIVDRERETDELIDSAIAEAITRPMSPLIVEIEIYDTLQPEQRSATNKQIAQRLNSGQRIAYEQLDFISGRLVIRWEYRHEESDTLRLTDAVAEAVAPDEIIAPSASPVRPSPFAAPIMPQSPLALRRPESQQQDTSKPVPTHAQLLEALKSGAIDAAQYSRTANAHAMYNVTSKG